MPNMIKRFVLNILTHPRLAGFFLRMSLKCHNISYQLSGILSAQIEPDKLHPKHRLMKYHDWFSSRLESDWNVLDIGCGNGALAFDMKASCRSVLGIDIEKKNIEKAKSLYAREGISYVCDDALEYDFKARFHAIVLSNVLEHIEHRVDFLKRIYANQDKKNPPVLLLRVPMVTRDWITLYKKEQGIEWRLDRSHYTEYTLEQIFEELKMAGLTVENYDIQFGEFYGVIKKNNE